MRRSLILACFLIASVAHARIGETPEQVTARYGPALRDHGFVEDGVFLPDKRSSAEVHEKNGIYVEVRYVDGRCAWIKYAKKSMRSGSIPTFTVEEMATLQSVCGPNAHDLAAKERLTGTGDDVFVFSTPDGTLSARAVSSDGQHFKQLVAYNDAWDRKVEADNAAYQARKLQNAQKSLTGF